MLNQFIILSNEAEYCSCIIYLENYSKGISQNRMSETTAKKIVRIFILWSNDGTA